MKDVAQLRCKFIRMLLDGDSEFLEKFQSMMNENDFLPEKHRDNAKNLEIKSRISEFSYLYRPTENSIIETTIGKKSGTSVHLSKDEFLQIATLFVNFIDSKGHYQAIEANFKKLPCSLVKKRTVLRLCEIFGLLKNTYLPGRIYVASGGKKKFVFLAEQAWNEKVQFLG